MEKIKALYHTFGCKLNFAETATVSNMLADRGITVVADNEIPDIIVVNTCSVTELADKKCRQTIRSFAKRYPDAAIVATGCYAQLKGEEVAALPGVVIVAGNDRKLRLADYIDSWLAHRRSMLELTPAKDIREFNPSCSRGDRTRYFLKVQDGCDYFCSYCTIPYARGRSRSGTVDEMVAQARSVVASGGKEIVLTGVNIGDFGKGGDTSFIDLVRELDKVEGIERYRISSIEPNLLTDEIIDFVAGSKCFMPHFHIPLQAGDDDVLRLMRRHYDTALFARRVERIRQVIPHAFIGVDVIAGSRGETPERFENSYSFIENLDITRLHVFPYSERPGTRALEIRPVVSQKDKHARVHRLMALSDDRLSRFTNSFSGTIRPVLVEHSIHGNTMSGFTDNYIRVEIPADQLLANKIVDVRLEGEITGDDQSLKGVVVK